MRWFFQIAALGWLTLCGGQTVCGQSSSTTTRGETDVEQGATGVQSNADAQLEVGDRRGAHEQGHGYYPNEDEPWFAADDLRRELELDDDQVERLRDIYNDSRAGMEARGSSEKLSSEARAERVRELRNNYEGDFAARSRDVFRDERQRTRFNQLGMQYRGYSVFDDPRLQRELNLNDTQRRQLEELNNSWNAELEDLRGTYASDRTGTQQRFNQLRERTRTNLEGILNERQRTAYDEMIGDRYDFDADAYLGASANGAQQSTGSRGSLLGTPQDKGPHGSGIGTPQGAAGAGRAGSVSSDSNSGSN